MLVSVEGAATYTAATCHYADFVTAIGLASDGDTVQGPLAGGSDPAWTTRLDITKSIILNGNGCNITLSGTDGIRMLSTNQSSYPRIAHFNFTGTNVLAAVWVDGNNPHFRVDHNTFTNLTARSISVDYGSLDSYSVQTYGVIDHNTFTYTVSTSAILVYGVNDAWFNDANWGTANAMYVETNTFVWNTGQPWAASQVTVDGWVGARLAVRFNDITDSFIEHHDGGGSPSYRGTRMFEHYGNTFHNDTSGFVNALSYRGGNGMDFNNHIPINASGINGFSNGIITEIKRLPGACTGSSCGAPMDFNTGVAAHAVCSSFKGWCSLGGTPTNQVCSFDSECTVGGGNTCNLTTAPPNNAACGASLTSVPYVSIANIDGSGSPSGYPSRDQNGVGKDDPATHAQTAAAEPSYSWNNTDPNNGNAVITGSTMVYTVTTGTYILANREYYQQVTPFTGASGVGVGLLASRPATCTVRVGYWATDTNTLYECLTTNTWTASYTPYTYPHPLVASDPGTILTGNTIRTANTVMQ